MAFKISYNITAIDKFSGVLKKIRKNFDDLNKKISGSGGVFKNTNEGARNVSSSLNDVRKKADKASASMGKMSSSLKTRQPSAFNRMLQNIGNTASVASGKIGNMFSHMKPKGYGDLGVRMGAAAAAGYAVKEGSDIQLEQMRLAPFVGGAKKARDVVNQLRETSIATGQSVEGLSSGLHSFLDVGMKTPEAMMRLKQTTDIAAFAGGDTKELARIFGDVQFKGRAGAEAFQILKDKHLDLRQELAKKMNFDISTLGGQKALDAYIESGQVTKKVFFELLQAKMAHDKVIGFAERAASLPMGEISKSWSSIKDSLSSIGESIGNMLLPALKLTSFVLSGIAKGMRWMKDNMPTTIGISSLVIFGALFIGKLRAIKQIAVGIGRVFMGTGTIMEILVNAAKAFVSPFKTLWKFLGKIFGFMTKIVKVAATFGLGAAKKAEEFIKPVASKVATSGVGRKIGASLATATAANPLVDIAASVIIPYVAGDATRNLKQIDKTPIAKGLLSANNADLTSLKAQSFISSLVNQSTGLANAENINKSHVKIEFEGKDAKINAIKQKDDSKNTFFDMSALGFNTFRGAY